MFEEKEVKDLIDKFDEDTIKNNSKLKYINNKIRKHGYLNVNLTEFNFLLGITNEKYVYNILELKTLLKTKGIGYTSMIKNLGIPKATLSKVLNNGRNIKLSKLNTLFNNFEKVYKIVIRKTDIKKGV